MDEYFSPKERLKSDAPKCGNCTYFDKPKGMPRATMGECMFRGNYPDGDAGPIRILHVQDLSVCSAWVNNPTAAAAPSNPFTAR